jgi:hypothetical protein
MLNCKAVDTAPSCCYCMQFLSGPDPVPSRCFWAHARPWVSVGRVRALVCHCLYILHEYTCVGLTTRIPQRSPKCSSMTQPQACHSHKHVTHGQRRQAASFWGLCKIQPPTGQPEFVFGGLFLANICCLMKLICVCLKAIALKAISNHKICI